MEMKLLRGGAIVSRPTGLVATRSVVLQYKFYIKLYLLILAILAAGASAPAVGAETWTVLHSSGPVLVLHGDQWADLPPGENVPEGVPVRTLRGATVTLSHAGQVVTLAPDSAARLDPATGSNTALTQFAGKLSVDAQVSRGRGLLIRTPALTVDVETGSARLAILAEAGKVEVATGSVVVSDPRTSVQTTVAAGEAVFLSDLEAAAAALMAPRGIANKLDGIETGSVANSLGTVAKSVESAIKKPRLVERTLPD